MIGKTLGRYQITAKLGEGGMGSVWRAEDPALGRTVALKLLSPALWASDTARQRFLREARAASQLDHPAIATVFDVGETDGLAWIAYQFIDGETVAARAERGAMPVADCLTLALDTAQALAHAHARSVLHRDVTAGNVMVTREGRGVLVDFGLALPDRGEHLTTTGVALGTAGYMAPEVMRGEPADERSDLYGLGAVIYRMLTGRLPFEGPPEAVLYRMLNESVPPPSDLRPELPGAFERVVMKLLEREPADRHASAQEVVEALREVAPERGPSNAVRAQRTLARRWRRAGEALRRAGRMRVGVTALAGTALIAVALGFAGRQGWLPGMAKGPQVIAVLPFDNTSVDPEEAAYLGEGLGDELVLKLGLASGYRMLPWATTRKLSVSTQPLPALARELRVDAFLVGTFRVNEDRVRVTASLVDGKSGVQRWSQLFDESLDDLMAVQSNIATGVARAIKGNLSASEQRALTHQPSKSPEAYSIYLQGVSYLHSSDFASRSFALPFFDRAIHLDPELAEAYIGRGAATLDQHFRGMGGGTQDLRNAKRDFTHALTLSPGLLRAELGLVTVGFECGRNEDMLQIAARVAGRGDSDVEGLLVRGWACMLSGYAETAIPILERALELDPASQQASWYLVVCLAWADQSARVLDAGKSYIRRFGEDPEIYLWMGVAAGQLKRDDESDAYLDRALELFGDENSNLYATVLAVGHFAARSRTQRLARLTAHWIPLLQARHAQVEDNFRVLSVLIGLEGFVGDTLEMKRHLARFAENARRDPDFNPSGLMLSIPGILRCGSLDALQRAIAVSSGRDPSGHYHLLREWWSAGVPQDQPTSSLANSTDFLSFKASIRARVGELGKKYLPQIALRTRGV